MRNALFFLTVLLLGAAACVQPPNYPDEPEIEYVGVNKSTIEQGSPSALSDTLVVTFSFTDGDGDIGDDDSTNVFLFDSRNGTLAEPLKLEPIPNQGTGNGISGEISVKIPNKPSRLCCIIGNTACISDPDQPVDTFSFTIQLRDRAGHLSNKIQTEPITLLCN